MENTEEFKRTIGNCRVFFDWIDVVVIYKNKQAYFVQRNIDYCKYMPIEMEGLENHKSLTAQNVVEIARGLNSTGTMMSLHGKKFEGSLEELVNEIEKSSI